MSGGNYFKLQEGANKFRILTPTITGYELWTDENKPVRYAKYPESIPGNIRPDSKIKHFWCFVVWNYAQEAVQILELTQSTIQTAINDLVILEEWGDPSNYDITVTRKGEGLETQYTVQPSPHKPVSAQILKAFESKKINLSALFDGGNPIEDGEEIQMDETVTLQRPKVIGG